MNAKAPPVPSENRSHKGPGDTGSPREGGDAVHAGAAPGNLGEQDRQGNIKQNTTHQGLQQDR